MSGIRLDGSGMGPAAKLATLYQLQGRRCAIPACPVLERVGPGRRLLVADHDHGTGLLRGLLCQSDNLRARAPRAHPDIAAYLAAPPAGQDWMWMLPDAWCPKCTATVQHLGCTALDYIRTRAYRQHVTAQKAAQTRRMLAVVVSAPLAALDGASGRGRTSTRRTA